MLAIRNDAFAQLGDHNLADCKVAGRAPAFAVTGQTALAPVNGVGRDAASRARSRCPAT